MNREDGTIEMRDNASSGVNGGDGRSAFPTRRPGWVLA